MILKEKQNKASVAEAKEHIKLTRVEHTQLVIEDQDDIEEE